MDYNDFGNAMKALNASSVAAAWKKLYSQDSDGDGLTNGAELGDPCGEWTQGGAPKRTKDITNPGDSDAAADPALECADAPSGGNDPPDTETPSTGAGLAKEKYDVPQGACSIGAGAGREAGASWAGAWAIAGALALLGARRRR